MRTTHVTAHTRSQMLNTTTTQQLSDEVHNKIKKEKEQQILTDILRWENGELSPIQEIELMQSIYDTGDPTQFGNTIKERILTLHAQGIITNAGISKHIRIKDSNGNIVPPENPDARIIKKTGIRATSNRSIIERFLKQSKPAKARHISIKITQFGPILYSFKTPISRFYLDNSLGKKYILINNDKTSKTTEVHKNILLRSAKSQKISFIKISFSKPHLQAIQDQITSNNIEIEKQILLSQKARKAIRREQFETELRQYNDQNNILKELRNSIPTSMPELTMEEIY